MPGRLHKMFLCTRLRRVDFLRIPAKQRILDETARHSPSGLKAGFSEHPCSEIPVYETESKENPNRLHRAASETSCAICRAICPVSFREAPFDTLILIGNCCNLSSLRFFMFQTGVPIFHRAIPVPPHCVLFLWTIPVTLPHWCRFQVQPFSALFRHFDFPMLRWLLRIF